MTAQMELEFYGATGEVTGSCHILHVGGRQVLLEEVLTDPRAAALCEAMRAAVKPPV